MGVTNRSFVAGSGGVFPTSAYQVLTFGWPPQIPASEADVEYGSIRLPSDGDWQVVSAHVWAKAVAGTSPQVKLQDDGTDIAAYVTVVAGAQTAIAMTTSPTRLAGGSELQVIVDTDAGETIDGLVVTLVVRPYPLSEAGVAVS